MDRADLSRPPKDAALLSDIIRDALSDLPEQGLISISTVVKQAMRQCPDSIGAAQIVEEVVKQAAATGLAIEFDR